MIEREIVKVSWEWEGGGGGDRLHVLVKGWEKTAKLANITNSTPILISNSTKKL